MNHISPEGFYALAFICGVVVGFGVFAALMPIIGKRRKNQRVCRYV